MGKEQELRPEALEAARAEFFSPNQLQSTKLERAIAAYLSAASDEQAEVVGWPSHDANETLRRVVEILKVAGLPPEGECDQFEWLRERLASPSAVAAGGVTEAEEGATDFGHELQPGAMYANYSHDGNPMTNDRLEWLSRWHPVAEVRVMAGDLWQRRAFDVVRRALAVGDEGIREGDDA